MRLRLRRLLPLFLLLCVLVLPAAAPAVQPGQMLVPFKGTDLDGQPFDLAESIGKRPCYQLGKREAGKKQREAEFDCRIGGAEGPYQFRHGRGINRHGNGTERCQEGTKKRGAALAHAH